MPEEVVVEEKKEVVEETPVVEPEKKEENRIPQSRFNEINERAKAAEAELAKIRKDNEAAEDARLVEKEEFKTLAEKRKVELDAFKVEAEKNAGMEETLSELLEAQMKAIPKELQSLVPDGLDTQAKLAYISKNAAILSKKDPVDVGFGKRGGNKDDKDKVVLTEDQKLAARNANVSEEEYAKYI